MQGSVVMLAVSDFGNEMVHCQRGSISVFREFYASINGVLISAGGGGGGWALGYYSVGFRYFPDIF